ncbi:MAG: methylenetetrahydrofolate reductase [Gammaproteobacteria bacterium]|jgi:methylenetetrahydrofolate reductase (NADPH)
MRRLSIELVPRNRESVEREARWIQEHCAQVDTINVPDLARFTLRSWEAIAITKQHVSRGIPHLRARDLRADDLPELVATLAEHRIREVVVINGEPRPDDDEEGMYPDEAIAALKHVAPTLRIYAALDPYCRTMQDEMTRMREKLSAGADGFFTQPFFDLRLMSIYMDLAPEAPVFWGVSPVLRERSRRYWEKTNRVVFPRDFEPSLEWNIDFARRAMGLVSEVGGNLYLMPIRTKLEDYLGPLLGESS